MSRALWLALAWNWLWPGSVPGHQPDTSHLTLRIGGSGIDAVFAADVATLQRLAPRLDADGDGGISRDEGEASRAAVATYLREHLFLDVDGGEVLWGDPQPLGWPMPDLAPIPQAEWHQMLLSYPFHLPGKALPGEVQVTCDVFIELGLTHKVIGEFQILDAVKHPVVFTLEEPDYRFNVGQALAKAPVRLPPPTITPALSAGRLFRRGLDASSRPATLLLVLTLLLAAPPGRASGWLAIFMLGLLLTSLPMTLLGVPFAARWLHLGQAVSLMSVSALNLRPTPSRPQRPELALVCGLLQGICFAAANRESCLSPGTAVPCLAAFQAGTTTGLTCAALFLTTILTLLGAWRPGSLLPKATSAAALLCGAGLLAAAFSPS